MVTVMIFLSWSTVAGPWKCGWYVVPSENGDGTARAVPNRGLQSYRGQPLGQIISKTSEAYVEFDKGIWLRMRAGGLWCRRACCEGCDPPGNSGRPGIELTDRCAAGRDVGAGSGDALRERTCCAWWSTNQEQVELVDVNVVGPSTCVRMFLPALMTSWIRSCAAEKNDATETCCCMDDHWRQLIIVHFWCVGLPSSKSNRRTCRTC